MQEDFIKIFHSSSIHYDVIGKGLGVTMTDFIETPYKPSSRLILVFQKWRDSNNDVTWEKVLKVCKDYPNKLQDATAKLIQFLLYAEDNISRIFSLEKEQMIHNSITDKELLKKEPSQRDLIRIIHSLSQASFHYAIIGTGLGVDVRNLIKRSNASLVDKLIVVIQRWKASNKNVTWGKILKVCEKFPNKLGRAKAELIKFLSSEEKQMIYDSITEELLKKELLPEDHERLRSLFSKASFHYVIIGVGLGVKVEDLFDRTDDQESLLLVFQRWRDLNNNVTWGKILQVCEDYPDELGRVKAELIKFLSSEKEQIIHDSIAEKEPLPEDFFTIIHSNDASFNYAIIGVGLGLNVRDLIKENLEHDEKIIVVFQRWRDSNNNVTWGKFFKVCEDYPNELGRVKAELKIFFLSEEAKINYLQPIEATPDAGEPIKNPNVGEHEESQTLTPESVNGLNTVFDLQYVYVWLDYIVLIFIATLIAIVAAFMYLRQNN